MREQEGYYLPKEEPEIVVHKPEITEEKLTRFNHIVFATLGGMIFILLFLFGVYFFSLNLLESLILAVGILFIYSVMLFLLLEPVVLRQVHTRESETISYPGEVKYLEKEVIKEKPVIKTVFFEKPGKKLSVPKYNFVGTTESRTYHKRSCRLGKLIKKKYKIHEDDSNWFKLRGYKPCKVCKPHLSRK
jgi:hypothetical protein